jgi:hypothetical protein
MNGEFGEESDIALSLAQEAACGIGRCVLSVVCAWNAIQWSGRCRSQGSVKRVLVGLYEHSSRRHSRMAIDHRELDDLPAYPHLRMGYYQS